MTEPIEYWIEIERRPAARKPYRWLIYRSGRRRPFRRAPYAHASRASARRAGDRCLDRLLDKLNG